jgi:hypothetical protein
LHALAYRARVLRGENADIRSRRARRQGAADDATELSHIRPPAKGGIPDGEEGKGREEEGGEEALREP